ncbi:MAG TPA: hypothetical protein VK952_08990 [Methylotenera sp.]|nr:hypothetical protein [Methylotenera sp.]
MIIFRLVLMLLLIAMFVLLAAYVVTKNKKYLTFLLVAIKFLGLSLAAMFVLFLISRVIRF